MDVDRLPVRWGGPVYESDDAYGDSFTPSGLGPRKHVQEVNWIPARGSATDNATIKNAVMEYGAAYVSMYWSASTSYYKAGTSSYYYPSSVGTNHAVLIVGWDDGYPASELLHHSFRERRVHREEQLGHLLGR